MTYFVGRVDNAIQAMEYDTLDEARGRLEKIMDYDPTGVALGEYYIDCPEEELDGQQKA
jgi:hypothetical protein